MNILSVNELYKLSLGELRDVTLQQIKIANENIKQLEESGYASLSQAYSSLAKRQGREKPSFSTNLEGLNHGQLVHRYVGASSYNSLKTSNVFGTKEVNIELLTRMGIDEIKAKKMTEDIALNEAQKHHNLQEIIDIKKEYGIDVREYWKIYRNYESDLSVIYGSTQAQEKLLDYVTANKSQGDLDNFNLEDYQRWLEQVRIDEEKAENERERLLNERKSGKLI